MNLHFPKLAAALSVLGCLLLSGCGSTLFLQKEARLQKFDGGPSPVYVTNPEQQPEYKILSEAKIYRLTDNPRGARQLTLRPIWSYGTCGNPLMLTLLTFGLVPGWLPGASVFEYELDAGGTSCLYRHSLPTYRRISIWEGLFKQDQDKVMAQALAMSAGRVHGDSALQPPAP